MYTDYYVNQAGSGVAGYHGVRYQKGSGFFGRLLKTVGMPLLKYFGKRALSTGVDIGKDLLTGENIKTSTKRRLKEGAETLLDDATVRAKKVLKGGGIRKKTITKRKRKTSRVPARRKTVKRKPIKRKRKKRKSLFE